MPSTGCIAPGEEVKVIERSMRLRSPRSCDTYLSAGGGGGGGGGGFFGSGIGNARTTSATSTDGGSGPPGDSGSLTHKAVTRGPGGQCGGGGGGVGSFGSGMGIANTSVIPASTSTTLWTTLLRTIVLHGESISETPHTTIGAENPQGCHVSIPIADDQSGRSGLSGSPTHGAATCRLDSAEEAAALVPSDQA